MINRNLLNGAIGILLLIPSILQAQTTDSSAIAKTVTTKTYIVAKGETLYSIARKNHSTIARLKELNPTVDFDKLKYGSKIIIPIARTTAAVTGSSTNTGRARVKTLTETSVSSDVIGTPGFLPLYHTVLRGETLTKIALQYHQSLSTLRQWNHLTSSTIMIGKKLIVGKQTGHAVQQTAYIGPNANAHQRMAHTDLIETTEQGTAKWEEETASQGKYLTGLCSLVPAGTVVKVTNPLNNISILVKITGTLPEDKTNTALIDIPATAAQLLNAHDEDFEVTLSYFMPAQLSLK